MTENNINLIYDKLLKTYSYQGWWPIIGYDGSNPTKTGAVKGYHPKDYSFPRNSKEQFEIIMGSVLTQNTSWPSVEKALNNLSLLSNFSAENILELADSCEDEFKQAIRPAGYFNQKFNYLKNIAEFYISLDAEIPSRKEVLAVKGIGNETADSILLFAYKQKQFKVDAYTKRIFSYLGYFDEKEKYMDIKKLFEDNFSGDVNAYQEYHALIVEHGKNCYLKKPYGAEDRILDEFKI